MRTLVSGLVCIALLTASTLAQPLADKVPAGPILYFGWSGSDNLGPAYADSHLKAVLDQSNFPAVFNYMIPAAVMRVSRANPEVGNVVRSITSVAGPMWRHPCAFYLADIDMSQKQPLPKAAIICKAGNDAPQMLQQLQMLTQQAEADLHIRTFQSGDIVALTIGYADSDDAVALASDKPLASDPSFTAAMVNVQKDSVLAVYIDFSRICQMADTCAATGRNPDFQNYWPKIRDASGLAGMKRLIATAGFDGKDWLEEAYLEAPTPRAGLMTMLDSKPLPDDLLKAAPADSDIVLAGTFDIAKFISVIRAGIAQVDPDAAQMSDRVFGGISMYIGRDFQKDVLEPIGEHWLCYTSPTIAGRGLLGMVLVNQPNDPVKANSGIVSCQIAAFNTVAGIMQRYGMTLRAQNINSDGMSINYIAMPLISPAWAIKDKDLYAALYPQTVITAARFVQSGEKSILDNADFIALRKRLDAPENLNCISYIDMRPTIGEGYQSALALSRLLLGMGDLFGVRAPEPVLPPLDVFIKNIGPSGGISYVDEKGWHSRSVSSFPGVEIFSGGNSGLTSLLSEAAPMIGGMGPMFQHHVQVESPQPQ